MGKRLNKFVPPPDTECFVEDNSPQLFFICTMFEIVSVAGHMFEIGLVSEQFVLVDRL